MRRFTDAARRARLARRHGLGEAHRHPDLLTATAAMTETQLTKMLCDAEVATDPAGWITAAATDVADLFADGIPRSAREIAVAVSALARRVSIGEGSKWATEVALAPTVLALLGARGIVIRAENAGDWRRSQPRWTAPQSWLDEQPPRVEEQVGNAMLVSARLATFGPGTEADLVWWLGSTKTAVRRALTDIGAVPVSLDDERVGWLHPDDDTSADDSDPWAALLPILDPTTMGWRERGFYLESRHVPYLFDSAGNAAATAWVDGRIVGSWVQDAEGRVRVVQRVDIPASRRRLLRAETDRLDALLGGQRISSPYTLALSRGLALS